MLNKPKKSKNDDLTLRMMQLFKNAKASKSSMTLASTDVLIFIANKLKIKIKE